MGFVTPWAKMASVISMRSAAVIWLLGATVYLVCEAAATASVPGYSYAGDFISDLGVRPVMNIGAFAVHGVLFLLGAVVMALSVPAAGRARVGFVLAAGANAVGNILLAVFHAGAPASAWHQQWHVVGAALAILGGNIAVLIAGFAGRRAGATGCYRRSSIAIGSFGIACLVGLTVDGLHGDRVLAVGLVERGSVYSIIGWELLTAWAILRRGRRSETR